MDRKLIYTFSLIGFFLMWGVFGFIAAGPRGELLPQATPPPVENTSIAPGATDPVGIPVTGEAEPVLIEVLIFYGLIGLAALFLVFGLLSFANRSTAPNIEHNKEPSPGKSRKE